MTENIDPVKIEDVAQIYTKLLAEVDRYIVGQDKVVELLFIALLTDGHVLLEGVPGIAKTSLAKTLAQTLNMSFNRIQFTPDLMPSDIIGTMVYNNKINDFEYKKGPVFKQLIVIDEINRAPAKTQSALFEAMQEKQISMEGQTHKLDQPFLVLATQNPIEFEGTYKLPEAQLDRFLFKIEMDYPSKEDETDILSRFHQNKLQFDVSGVKKIITGKKVREMQDLARQIYVKPEIITYIINLVEQTRHHPAFYLGASTRAAMVLLASAKSYALVHQRDFVTPDDIRNLLKPVMGHRLILTPEAEMEGRTLAELFSEINEKVEVPN
jgi:MoxR-like ATPase